MTSGFSRRCISAVVLGASTLAVALTGCVGTGGHAAAPARQQQNLPLPTMSQVPGQLAPERIVIIGDSLSTGYGTAPEEAWPRLLEQDLRSQRQRHPVEVINAAQDGAGYIAVGDDGGAFGSQINATIDASTDIVVFFGSDNDAGQDPGELKSAITDALQASNKLAPHATRIMIGPLTAFDSVQSDIKMIRDQERVAAHEAGIDFVDPVAERWIPHPDSPLLGPDNEHPSSQGQEFLEQKIKGLVTTLKGRTTPSLPKSQPTSSHPVSPVAEATKRS
ncbi:SGNH/GDSL hydrolase family protein [Pseudarthrobacter sp. fls2-241-R2A-127]|uniref:SGNH/GDSL hydrolase family protein n=1 Tax=Pseudarthrobacter sp. fls2-241-R2A-127 TaxID=3040303 RepID=UPI002553860B|nr:SGNH/GDSL hydrolase family protein [Pseudarthrobacter sp. fls2-241-R2A-127]